MTEAVANSPWTIGLIAYLMAILAAAAWAQGNKS